MFCTKCGSPVPDNSVFCGKCGSRLKIDPVSAGGASANPIPTSAPAPAQQEPAAWDAYFLNRWKKFLSSPLILVMLVCATLLQVMNISSMSSVEDALNALSYYSRDVVEIMDLVVKGVMLFGILSVVSMWMVFLDGRKGGPRLSTTGITILQTLQSIMLVLVCAALGYVAVGYMELMEEMDSYYYASYYSSVRSEMNKLMLWVIGICIFAIVHCIMVLRLLKSVKTTMRTFIPICTGAMFVGVVEILLGLLIIYAMTNLVMGSMDLTMILSLVSPFLYGIAAISYRNLAEDLDRERIRMIR